MAQISDIDGQLPAYLDIGSVEAWPTVVEGVLERHEKLLAVGSP